MNSVVEIFSALGGGCAFVTCLFVVIRGIFKQVGATEDNTKALHEVSEALRASQQKLDNHETRISHLEGLERWPR